MSSQRCVENNLLFKYVIINFEVTIDFLYNISKTVNRNKWLFVNINKSGCSLLSISDSKFQYRCLCLAMYLNADCTIFLYMLDDLSDNGYDPFDFIYIHAKTLWFNLIKKIRKKLLWFSFLKKYDINHQLILQSLIRTPVWKGWLWIACFTIKNSHKPNYDCQACKASGQ